MEGCPFIEPDAEASIRIDLLDRPKYPFLERGRPWIVIRKLDPFALTELSELGAIHGALAGLLPEQPRVVRHFLAVCSFNLQEVVFEIDVADNGRAAVSNTKLLKAACAIVDAVAGRVVPSNLTVLDVLLHQDRSQLAEYIERSRAFTIRPDAPCQLLSFVRVGRENDGAIGSRVELLHDGLETGCATRVGVELATLGEQTRSPCRLVDPESVDR